MNLINSIFHHYEYFSMLLIVWSHLYERFDEFFNTCPMANKCNTYNGSSYCDCCHSRIQSFNQGHQVSIRLFLDRPNLVGEGLPSPSLEDYICRMEESQDQLVYLIYKKHQLRSLLYDYDEDYDQLHVRLSQFKDGMGLAHSIMTLSLAHNPMVAGMNFCCPFFQQCPQRHPLG